MPAIAQKAKALSGKGVVLSYVDKPDNFYWREQVPGTKRYLHRLLPNASTIEEALEECIEAYTALRQEQAAPELIESLGHSQVPQDSPRRDARTSNSGRYKNRPVDACVKEFIEVEQRRKAGPDEYIFGAVVDRDVAEGVTIGGIEPAHLLL